jgi:small conductance mechanosensitive channel
MDLNLEKAQGLLTVKLQTWLEVTFKNLPNFLVALLILFVFFLLAKFARKIIRRISTKLIRNQSINDLLSTLTYLGVIFLGLFISLGVLSLDKTLTSLLAGAGVLGLAIGFAAQEIAANFISGVIIAIREPYRIGDIIEVSDYKGQVTSVNLRTTNIRTFDGLEVFVPNRLLFSDPFINLTSTSDRRIDLSIGVSYGDKLETVSEIIKNSLESISFRTKGKEIAVYFTEFGDSSVNLVVHIWISYSKNTDYLQARHESIIKIKSAFDKNNIMIPFPIRTLDFGIKGGESLSAQAKSISLNKMEENNEEPS